MILSVCLNPSIDTAIYVDEFTLGQINRSNKVVKVAGGKGNNTARIVKAMGEDVASFNLIGGYEGQFILEHLRSLDIKCHYNLIKGDNRRCIAILTEPLTELREAGPEISIGEYRETLCKFSELVKDYKVITMSGSLPLGMPESIYHELIEIAKQEGVKVLLDAKSKALSLGIKAKPYLVKINEEELLEYMNQEKLSKLEVVEALKYIQSQGVKIAIVSLGENGMIANWQGNIYQVAVPEIKVVSPVGAGDAVLGALAVGISREHTVEKVLKSSAAMGSAAALKAATGEFCSGDYLKILEKIELSLLG